MRDPNKATTPQVVQPGPKTKPTPYRVRAQWDPVFADLNQLRPVGWQCPCGWGADMERISCPNCGRIARDAAPHGKLDGSQRCTTGRQGRSWKRTAKGGRC
jgi:hypothetical protein